MRKREEKPPRRILAWSLIREVGGCAPGSNGLRDRELPGRGTKAVRLLLSPRTSFDEHVNDGFPRWNSDPVTRCERHYNPCRLTISNRQMIADCRTATDKIRRTILLDVLSRPIACSRCPSLHKSEDSLPASDRTIQPEASTQREQNFFTKPKRG